MLGKQAKILSELQIKAVLGALEGSRNGLRNKVMFLLSLHGLRAKEIASLEISMITDSEGHLLDHIALQDKAAKGRSGRVIYMNQALLEALAEYLDERKEQVSSFVIVTARSERFSANAVAVMFKRFYSRLGFEQTSSHSGRRTFITLAARKIEAAGGSLRDVMALAGHRYLSTMQRYIEQNKDAQRRVLTGLY